MNELEILREARAIIGNSDYPEKKRTKLYLELEKFIASKEKFNNKTAENKEFSDIVKEETEQNIKHIQGMISEDDKK